MSIPTFSKRVCTLYLILLKRTAETTQCFVAIFTANDKLGDHGVIVNADLVALVEARLDAHILRGFGCAHAEESASIGQKVAKDGMSVCNKRVR